MSTEKRKSPLSAVPSGSGESASVGVVVPVYNGGSYLAECLDSIRRQTFGDFSVLVVDDGSTDDSAAIARRFCDTDSRFRLVCTANRGVSAARNIGIDSCRNRYLTFVDADDLLHPRALELLVGSAERHDARVTVGRFQTGTDCPFGAADLSAADAESVCLDYRQAMTDALYQKRILNAPWGVLYRRELFDGGERFREGIRYEDLDAFYRFFENAGKIVCLDYPVYFYRQVPSSFIHSWSRGRLDVLDVTDRMLRFMEERHPSLAAAAADRRFSAHFNMLLAIYRYRADEPEAVRRCLDVIRGDRRRELSDRNVRLKNKAGALLSYLGTGTLKFISLFYRP